MADAVTLEQFLGIIVVALGGTEGVKLLLRWGNDKWRNDKSNKNSKTKDYIAKDYVTKEFCGERHRNLEVMVKEMKEDVKVLLTRTKRDSNK